jgi:hypothetical protein
MVPIAHCGRHDLRLVGRRREEERAGKGTLLEGYLLRGVEGSVLILWATSHDLRRG